MSKRNPNVTRNRRVGSDVKSHRRQRAMKKALKSSRSEGQSNPKWEIMYKTHRETATLLAQSTKTVIAQYQNPDSVDTVLANTTVIELSVMIKADTDILVENLKSAKEKLDALGHKASDIITVDDTEDLIELQGKYEEILVAIGEFTATHGKQLTSWLDPKSVITGEENVGE